MLLRKLLRGVLTFTGSKCWDGSELVANNYQDVWLRRFDWTMAMKDGLHFPTRKDLTFSCLSWSVISWSAVTTHLCCWHTSCLLLSFWVCALQSLVSLEDHILWCVHGLCLAPCWCPWPDDLFTKRSPQLGMNLSPSWSAQFFTSFTLSLPLNWHIMSFHVYFPMTNHWPVDLVPVGNSFTQCLISA